MHREFQQTQRRPLPPPEGPWQYRQEWNDAVFLHWRAAP